MSGRPTPMAGTPPGAPAATGISPGPPAAARMPPDTGAAPGALEVALAHVLQLGTYLSIGLIGVGSMLLFAAGGSPVAGGPPLALDRIIPDLLALRPAGFLWLGIVGVLATPGLRVLRALFGFWRRGEQRMALVALLVLVVVAVGVVAGLLSG